MKPVVQDLTVRQVAIALQCSPKTVRALAKKGTLRGYRIGRDWRFQALELDAFRRRRSVTDSIVAMQKPRTKGRAGGHLPGWHDFDHGRPS